MFGPAFSSDNAGDGPITTTPGPHTGIKGKISFGRTGEPLAQSLITPLKAQISQSKVDEVPLIHYPKIPDNISERSLLATLYQTHDFHRWVRDFRNLLPANLLNILDGAEERIARPTVSTYTGNQLINFTNSQERHIYIYRSLYFCITNSTDPLKDEALASIEAYRTDEAHEAWQAVLKLRNDPTVTNKLQTVQSLLTLQQNPGETTLALKLRHDAVFRRIATLDVKLSDIQVAQYLMGLDPKYSDLVQQLCLQHGDTLTMSQAYKSITDRDQMLELSSTQRTGSAFIAQENSSSSSTNASTKKQQSPSAPADPIAKALQQQTAMLSRFLTKHGSGGGDGGGDGGSGDSDGGDSDGDHSVGYKSIQECREETIQGNKLYLLICTYFCLCSLIFAYICLYLLIFAYICLFLLIFVSIHRRFI
jgi:hypothetical protein